MLELRDASNLSIQDFMDLECRNDKAPTPRGASFDDVLMYAQAAIWCGGLVWSWLWIVPGVAADDGFRVISVLQALRRLECAFDHLQFLMILRLLKSWGIVGHTDPWIW